MTKHYTITKDYIMARCRRVAIPIEGKRIFGDLESPYQFVTAFRTRQLAENNLRARASLGSKAPETEQTVCEFYLVPAFCIDGTPADCKK